MFAVVGVELVFVVGADSLSAILLNDITNANPDVMWFSNVKEYEKQVPTMSGK